MRALAVLPAGPCVGPVARLTRGGGKLAAARPALRHARSPSHRLCSCKAGSSSPQIYVETPLIKSTPMSELLGLPVWLKMDALQPSGSFKLRGVSLACQRAIEGGATCLVSSSGGNAGLAVAYAGQVLGIPVTVVLPETTPAFISGKLRSYGAEVIVHGAMWSEANARAEEVAGAKGGVLIHPFDMEDLWDGHATLVEEVKRELGGEKPGAFVAAVGGGGLLMGVLTGLDRVGWGDVPVVATETVGADCLAQSLEAGQEVTMTAITSIAKSLGSPYPSKKLFAKCVDKGPELVRPWVCTDKQAVEACYRFAEDHRVLVEPACGAALAAVYSRSPALLGVGGGVVVEVCGGAIVTPASLEAMRAEYM